jgi:predicted Zn-dependent peptidase
MTALAPLATSLAAPRVARPRAAGTRATRAVPRAMAQPVAVARPAASGASVGAPRHAAVVAPLRARRVVPRGARRAAQPAVLAAASKPDPSAGAGAKEPGSSASDGRWSSVVRALADVMEPSAVASLLDEELPAHEDIHRGRLANGLRYVVLPNKVPGDRFEAHLEMHVGSVDERADEQGLAHLVEHVTFLGSKKRDAWLGSGTRGNAYTDFHHTVFHVHSPTYNKDSTYMIPNVLDILYDVAFNPQLLDTRVAKEKKAVLAEAQMMNTIEYRVDCQLLQHLHWDNNLGCRFPIGKLDQVERWDAEKVRQFHERWYFPANATLYVVGDFHADVPGVVEMIEQAFGAADPATHAPGFVGPVPENPESTPAFEGATKAPTMADGDAEGAESSGALRDRHSVRPPVRHAYGCPPTAAELIRRNAEAAAAAGVVDPYQPMVAHESGVQLFQHEHLSHVSFNIFSKLPVLPLRHMGDLHRTVNQRIALLVLQSRIQSRYAELDHEHYKRCELDHSDSAREGCTVSTVTVTCEPLHWKYALQVAVEEARRLKQHGLTPGELTRFKSAMMRDSEQLAQQAGFVPSLENLDFVMEHDALGHVVMDQVQGHEALVRLDDVICLEGVNEVARELLGFFAEYGAAPEERDPAGGVTTAIVACVPSTTTDNAGVEVPFSVSEQEVIDVLSADYGEIEAMEDVFVPDELLSEEELDELVRARAPAIVSSSVDEATGVHQRVLSNGVRVNYRVTNNEPGSAFLRLVVPGGRTAESAAPGPGGIGAAAVGFRTLQEVGAVGQWSRKQVELITMQNLVMFEVEPEAEYLFLDAAFAVKGGLRTTLEIVHLLVSQPVWDANALERVKDIYRMFELNTQRNLELLTHDKVNHAVFGDRRLMDPSREELAALDLDGVVRAVEAQLRAGPLEVNIAGDVDPAELDAMLVRFLGTAAPGGALTPQLDVAPLDLTPLALRDVAPGDVAARAQRMWLRDSDERACAVLAGPGPRMWAPMHNPPLPPLDEIETPVDADGNPVLTPAALAGFHPADQVNAAAHAAGNPFAARSARRANPLAMFVAGMLLTEVIGGRLFTTVRDALGLTYDCNFQLAFGLQNSDATTFRLVVTSTPAKIDDALAAAIRVLRGFRAQRVTQREVERARMTLLTRHETELKTNAYWVDLMQYTALGEVLAPAKDVSCIADLPAMYEAATVEDLYEVYQQLGLDDGEVFTCVTVAGKEDPALAAAAAPPTAAGAAAAAAAAFGAPVGEGDAGMRAAAAAAASLGMAMNGGMAIAEALKKMGGGAASPESDDGIDVK